MQWAKRGKRPGTRNRELRSAVGEGGGGNGGMAYLGHGDIGDLS